jgi:hypothetical protein
VDATLIRGGAEKSLRGDTALPRPVRRRQRQQISAPALLRDSSLTGQPWNTWCGHRYRTAALEVREQRRCHRAARLRARPHGHTDFAHFGSGTPSTATSATAGCWRLTGVVENMIASYDD